MILNFRKSMSRLDWKQPRPGASGVAPFARKLYRYRFRWSLSRSSPETTRRRHAPRGGSQSDRAQPLIIHLYIRKETIFQPGLSSPERTNVKRSSRNRNEPKNRYFWERLPSGPSVASLRTRTFCRLVILPRFTRSRQTIRLTFLLEILILSPWNAIKFPVLFLDFKKISVP